MVIFYKQPDWKKFTSNKIHPFFMNNTDEETCINTALCFKCIQNQTVKFKNRKMHSDY